MTLQFVPTNEYFTFKGFPNDVCKVLERSHQAVRVEELSEISWYEHLREVVYPVESKKIIEYEQRKILQSKL